MQLTHLCVASSLDEHAHLVLLGFTASFEQALQSL